MVQFKLEVEDDCEVVRRLGITKKRLQTFNIGNDEDISEAALDRYEEEWLPTDNSSLGHATADPEMEKGQVNPENVDPNIDLLTNRGSLKL